MSAADPLAGLDPAGVWERFAELTRIPRPPKEEEQARQWVLGWAGERGFESAIDEVGNAIVRVPASPDRGEAPVVVLQAHLDIVCEREPGSAYDPREGRIRVELDGDWVVAPETTLGADNGVGVAAALAVADAASVAHGPLELLFTVCEEAGLDGAKDLDPSLVRGRLLLNLDGTSDRSLTVGCAGSLHTFARLDLQVEPLASESVLRVALTGARGGHSGADIHRGRANAIKGLATLLSRAFDEAPFRLATLRGGVSRNAIPREAEATVALDSGDEELFRATLAKGLTALRDRHAGSDDGLEMEIERANAERAASLAGTRRALDLVAVHPAGVLATHPLAPGQIETSASLTVAKTEEGVLELACMIRSANPVALEDVAAGIVAAARLADAEVELLRSYPPWRPDLGSHLLEVAQATFERVSGSAPQLEIVHGGLECAVLGDRLPGVQMLALGPEIVGPHAPGERVSVSSTQRFYRLLAALLDDLSR